MFVRSGTGSTSWLPHRLSVLGATSCIQGASCTAGAEAVVAIFSSLSMITLCTLHLP